MFSDQEKWRFVEFFIEEKRSYANFKRRVRKEDGRNTKMPSRSRLLDWLTKLRTTFNGQSQRGKTEKK